MSQLLDEYKALIATRPLPKDQYPHLDDLMKSCFVMGAAAALRILLSGQNGTLDDIIRNLVAIHEGIGEFATDDFLKNLEKASGLDS